MKEKPKNERTSASIASIAAKGLDNPGLLTLKEIKAVCASVLTQAPDKPKRKKKCKPS